MSDGTGLIVVVDDLVHDPLAVTERSLQVGQLLLPDAAAVASVVTEQDVILLLDLQRCSLMQVIIRQYPPLFLRAEALDILHAARKELRMPDPHFIGPHRQVQSIEYIQIILQRNADLAPLPFLNGALVPPQHIRKLLLGSARHVPGKGNGFPDSVPVVGHILSLLTHTCPPGISTPGGIKYFPLIKG